MIALSKNSVAVQKGQGEQKSCYELGTDVACQLVVAGSQTTTDCADFVCPFAVRMVSLGAVHEADTMSLHLFLERGERAIRQFA